MQSGEVAHVSVVCQVMHLLPVCLLGAGTVAIQPNRQCLQFKRDVDGVGEVGKDGLGSRSRALLLRVSIASPLAVGVSSGVFAKPD